MRVQLELNRTKFIVRVVSAEDGIKPGYVCESDIAAKIYLSASEAINKTYNNLFNNKTRYSGPSVLGFDDENIIQELLSDVLFYPFKITVDKLSILIIELGYSNGNNMVGYRSSFMYKYQDKQSLFVQRIEDKKCHIEIFQQKEKIVHYSDISPIEVWKKTGILKNYNGNVLFGIEHPTTIDILKNCEELPIC
ncbi:10062_t:CDS:1, partial [Gigaspora rosea]